jgi:hypothetical protein
MNHKLDLKMFEFLFKKFSIFYKKISKLILNI